MSPECILSTRKKRMSPITQCWDNNLFKKTTISKNNKDSFGLSSIFMANSTYQFQICQDNEYIIMYRVEYVERMKEGLEERNLLGWTEITCMQFMECNPSSTMNSWVRRPSCHKDWFAILIIYDNHKVYRSLMTNQIVSSVMHLTLLQVCNRKRKREVKTDAKSLSRIKLTYAYITVLNSVKLFFAHTNDRN